MITLSEMRARLLELEMQYGDIPVAIKAPDCIMRSEFRIIKTSKSITKNLCARNIPHNFIGIIS